VAELAESLRAVIERTKDQPSPFDRHRGNIAGLAYAILLAESGDEAGARAQVAAIAGARSGDLPRDAYWLATMVLLGEVSAFLGDRERGVVLYDRLLPYAGRNAPAGSGVLYFGAVSHCLGLLATLLARWENGARHFEAALRMNARMRAVPALARTRVAFARLLLARGTSEDRVRAGELLAQAQATADELDMIRLAAEATELRERLPGRRSPAGGNAADRLGLSERELEVLRLLAARRSNPEIAEALFISRATVRTHVDNILGKLGVHSRTEAVDVAVRAGLLTTATSA
jgi:DNA-binding CsgD family transcriptional regulator